MNAELPNCFRMVQWIPISHHGETFYQCTIFGFDLTATATSRSKAKALGHALEELSQQIMRMEMPAEQIP